MRRIARMTGRSAAAEVKRNRFIPQGCRICTLFIEKYNKS
jgi:hypothetical protein